MSISDRSSARTRSASKGGLLYRFVLLHVGVSTDTHAALWTTVVAIGIYHGLNPAMGWPLAVANGMAAKRGSAVFMTGAPLGTGHLLAMAVVLVPFTVLGWLLEWSLSIRLGAGFGVLSFGAYKLIARRHPRLLARIRPSQLTLWSFLVATAHGAGLMLVPVMLGLCAAAPLPTPHAANEMPAAFSHEALMAIMRSDATTALGVAAVHTLSMIVSGLAIAWLVYRYLGLRFIAHSWFNLDSVWSASLVLAGGVSCWMALAARV